MSTNVSKLAHSHMLQLFDKLALHQAWHDNDTDSDTHTHTLSLQALITGLFTALTGRTDHWSHEPFSWCVILCVCFKR